MSRQTINLGKNGEPISVTFAAYRGTDKRGKELSKRKKTCKFPYDITTQKARNQFITAERLKFEEEISYGITKSNRRTFGDYARYIIECKEREGLKRNTLDRYNRDLKNRILPMFEHLQLTEISPEFVNSFINELSKDGCNKNSGGKLSAKTIREIHRILHIVFDYACKERLIKFNPAQFTRLPKTTNAAVNYLQIEDLVALQQRLEKAPLQWRTMVYILLATGCRRGELAGIKRESIDLENSTIYIGNALVTNCSYGTYDETPKTHSSNRFVKLPEKVCALLQEHLKTLDTKTATLGGEWANGDYIFRNEQTGKVLRPDYLTKSLAKFCERENIAHINPHALRHTFASVLIASGVDIVTVSKALGHEQASFTGNVYSHLIKQAMSKVTDIIGEKLIV